jgi:hypothetical protein
MTVKDEGSFSTSNGRLITIGSAGRIIERYRFDGKVLVAESVTTGDAFRYRKISNRRCQR